MSQDQSYAVIWADRELAVRILQQLDKAYDSAQTHGHPVPAEIQQACYAARRFLADRGLTQPSPRGEAGDYCEVGNNCGRLGCPECQS